MTRKVKEASKVNKKGVNEYSRIIEEASRYPSKAEFKKFSPFAYYAAHRLKKSPLFKAKT